MIIYIYTPIILYRYNIGGAPDSFPIDVFLYGAVYKKFYVYLPIRYGLVYY